MSVTIDTAVPTPDAVPIPSPWARVGLLFARPARAWTGLNQRVQWWFPLLIVAVAYALALLTTYQKSYLPMITSSIEQRVAAEQMSADQAAQVERMYGSPGGMAIMTCILSLQYLLVVFVFSLLVWLGGAFVLGRPFRYRLALELTWWAELVRLVQVLADHAVAYFGGIELLHVHTGFGVLLPEPETPSKLITAAGRFLDMIGPLGLWYAAVLVLGLSALTGAPRKAAAFVGGGIYLIFALLLAALSGLSAPGS
jgi:hypothetical protein